MAATVRFKKRCQLWKWKKVTFVPDQLLTRKEVRPLEAFFWSNLKEIIGRVGTGCCHDIQLWKSDLLHFTKKQYLFEDPETSPLWELSPVLQHPSRSMKTTTVKVISGIPKWSSLGVFGPPLLSTQEDTTGVLCLAWCIQYDRGRD